MVNKKFIDFWNWFAQHSNQLHSDKYDAKLLSKLDETISSWNFTWEIGPGLTKKNSLTISPTGDKELLEQTSKIIDSAPELEDWEFYSSKQPKENWQKANFDGIKVDAENWTYVLLKYPDNKNEILIQADNLKQLDTSIKELAVDLVLTNLLGEKIRIEQIDFMDIVDKHENENGITQLKFLPAHIDKIKNST
jgi:hypothetical protein